MYFCFPKLLLFLSCSLKSARSCGLLRRGRKLPHGQETDEVQSPNSQTSSKAKNPMSTGPCVPHNTTLLILTSPFLSIFMERGQIFFFFFFKRASSLQINTLYQVKIKTLYHHIKPQISYLIIRLYTSYWLSQLVYT